MREKKERNELKMRERKKGGKNSEQMRTSEK